jgi:hypothetical protein
MTAIRRASARVAIVAACAAVIVLPSCRKDATSGDSPRDVRAAITGLQWSRPDANGDGLAECLRLDIALELPPGARCMDAGSTLDEPLLGDGLRHLAVAADPRLIAADYLLNSAATPVTVANDAGRCTLTVAFDGDSLRLASRDGAWLARLHLAWNMGARPGANGAIDREEPTPPQSAKTFGREWTRIKR